MGNFADAVEWAGRLGGIEGKIEVVYPPEKRLDWWEHLTEMTTRLLAGVLTQSGLKADFRMPAETDYKF